MRKSDLKPGMVIEKRDGSRNLVTRVCDSDGERKWPNLDGCMYMNSNSYNDDLTIRSGLTSFDYTLDVVKVYKDYTCQEVLWKREERPRLTETEKTILRNIDPMYTYIARDAFGVMGISGGLHVYSEKPVKKAANVWGTNNSYSQLRVYNHMFSFIGWGDSKPYSIAYLLGECDSNE